MKTLKTEAEMIQFGEEIAKKISVPAVIELVGDVGTGKTTITKGIAKGLGIKDEITSPSFMISKRYDFVKNDEPKSLVHYDFYRLAEPGIMQEDLLENLNDQNTVTVIEWGDTIKNLLPANHHTYLIKLNDDGSREVTEEK